MNHHIYLYGVIGQDVFLKNVIEQLGEVHSGETVTAHIHSPGGFVSEGYAIYDYLVSQAKQLGFNLETIAEGECKSIATVIFLAAPVRKITSNSEFMIHNPWGANEGDAASMQKYASMLKEEEKMLAKFYSKKIGIEIAEILNWMKVESYYSASEAVKMGFATEVIDTMKAVALYKENNLNNNLINPKMNKPNFNLQNFKAIAKRALKALSGEAVKNLDAVLEDGTAIFISTEATEPAIGDEVYLTETGEYAPDGTHTLDTGMVIVTVGGLITEINPVAAQSVQELQARITELETALAEVQPIIANLSSITGDFTPSAKAQRTVQTGPGRAEGASKTKAVSSFDKSQIKPNQRASK
jgi:ATP-dependent protease ClpP protease subunit